MDYFKPSYHMVVLFTIIALSNAYVSWVTGYLVNFLMFIFLLGMAGANFLIVRDQKRFERPPKVLQDTFESDQWSAIIDSQNPKDQGK